MRYRVAFFGTPEFAVPMLQALLDGPDTVVGVVCQPDKPAGRGQQLHAPAVKRLAAQRGVPVAQPVKVKTDELPRRAGELAARPVDRRRLRAHPAGAAARTHLGCISVRVLLPAYVARHRSSGRSSTATTRPASPSCA